VILLQQWQCKFPELFAADARVVYCKQPVHAPESGNRLVDTLIKYPESELGAPGKRIIVIGRLEPVYLCRQQYSQDDPGGQCKQRAFGYDALTGTVLFTSIRAAKRYAAIIHVHAEYLLQSTTHAQAHNTPGSTTMLDVVYTGLWHCSAQCFSANVKID
jgi:hypothetical protein